jgi:hypothetical protein
LDLASRYLASEIDRRASLPISTPSSTYPPNYVCEPGK